MMYLLDVNALVALGFANHEFHQRIAKWIGNRSNLTLATCSITELGFLRVLAQAPAYGLTVAQARTLLIYMKATDIFRSTFLPDDHDISYLPNWVKAPKQITDGHLIKLATANGGMLATFDARIPGAYLIPER
jgi:predicted nucleic acid-binding protein